MDGRASSGASGMTQMMCRWVWDWAEANGIALGRTAPWVFGRMIGASFWERLPRVTARRAEDI